MKFLIPSKKSSLTQSITRKSCKNKQNSFNRCAYCSERATHYCCCSTESMCTQHVPNHLRKDSSDHIIGAIKRYLSNQDKISIITKIEEKVNILKGCLEKILSSTSVLISGIMKLCKASVETLDQNIFEINKLVLLTHTELTYGQVQEIQSKLD